MRVRLRNLKRQGRQLLSSYLNREICLFGLTGVKANGSDGFEEPQLIFQISTQGLKLTLSEIRLRKTTTTKKVLH